MLEGIKTTHDCPECVCQLQYDVSESVDGELVIHIYCQNDLCDYFTWVHVNPIAKEMY